jgi:hypothetical protein
MLRAAHSRHRRQPRDLVAVDLNRHTVDLAGGKPDDAAGIGIRLYTAAEN